MENRLKEIIRGIVNEIRSENELEEGITSSAGAPFTKPSDVSSKNAKLAKLSGATVVGEDILNLKQEPSKPVAANDVKDGEIADVSGMAVTEDSDGLHLKENRWLAIKNEEGSPKAKMSRGVSSIKQQLGEVEKFVNWYSKIKNENGVKRDDYYKRTHKSLHKIKERLINLSEKIRTL